MTRQRLSRRTTLAWTAAIAWMALIFLSSAQTNAYLSPDPTTDFELRKAAHFLVFAVLAFLLTKALGDAPVKRTACIAFVISALYAASDEFHQAFVATRGPKVTDVLIDAIGAAAGIVLWLTLMRLRLAMRRPK